MQSKEILLCILTFFINWHSFLWIDLLFARSVLTKNSGGERFSQMFARDPLQFRNCDQSLKPYGPVVPKVLILDVGDWNLYGKILKAGLDDLVVRVNFQLRTCTTCVHEGLPQIAVGTQWTDPANRGHKLYLPMYWVSFLYLARYFLS